MSNPTPFFPGDVWPPRGPRTDHPLRAVVTRSGVPPYAWDWSVDVVDPATGRRDVELDSVDYGSVSTHTEALAAVTAVLERIGITERLESIRASIREESVSYGELAELQGLAPHISAGDVELLEAAGVPERPAQNDARFWAMDDTSEVQPFGAASHMVVDEKAGGVVAYANDAKLAALIVTALEERAAADVRQDALELAGERGADYNDDGHL